MNIQLKNKLKVMLGETDAATQLFEMLDAPDNEFDAVFPVLKKALGQSFSSPAAQQDMIRQLQSNSNFTIEELKEAVNGLNNEINNDSTLSNNKKALLCELFIYSGQSIIDFSENPRERIEVKIKKLTPDAIIPSYAHSSDAGADISANETITINPNETVLVSTGLAVAIPLGYEITIRPRSGMSLKTPLRIANSPATIDSAYRGEIKIIMSNIGTESYTINKGDKIAQILINPIPMIMWQETDSLDDTDRGENGFGSTDKS